MILTLNPQLENSVTFTKSIPSHTHTHQYVQYVFVCVRSIGMQAAIIMHGRSTTIGTQIVVLYRIPGFERGIELTCYEKKNK